MPLQRPARYGRAAHPRSAYGQRAPASSPSLRCPPPGNGRPRSRACPPRAEFRSRHRHPQSLRSASRPETSALPSDDTMIVTVVPTPAPTPPWPRCRRVLPLRFPDDAIRTHDRQKSYRHLRPKVRTKEKLRAGLQTHMQTCPLPARRRQRTRNLDAIMSQPHATHLNRRRRRGRLLPAQPRHRLLLQTPGRPQHGGVFRLRALRPVVARRHLDGRHHLRRRHASRRDRHGGARRYRRQLAVVELHLQRDAYRVLLCPSLASRRRHDRRRVCRDPLRRQARGFPARLPGHLLGGTDQLHHHGLGQPGHGQGVDAAARRREARSHPTRAGSHRAHLCRLDPRRHSWRLRRRPRAVRGHDEHVRRLRPLCHPGRRRHGRLESRPPRRRSHVCQAPLPPRLQLPLDADAHLLRLHRRQLVGNMVIPARSPAAAASSPSACSRRKTKVIRFWPPSGST